MPQTEALEALRLMAWLSPGYPVGAYAYSHGLEWAVEAGDVRDEASLMAWLRDVCERGALRNDLILAAHAHAAALSSDGAALVAVNDLALALAPSRELHLETSQQGRSFLDAARLADYRNYFVYEIGMRDGAGNRTTMSARALRGSGGEAQAPFYVAIAASLASAYYPGDRPGDENPGLGLCLLDEAFSKLDVRNSQALVDLYRAWGLQLLIAAPEDKRTTLTEVMDTIVTVYKSPDLTSVRIEAEHPLEAARRALHAINPDQVGIEGFRQSDAAE
ncbi:hypothetical protein MOF8_27280 [Methylobacterium oryzae]